MFHSKGKAEWIMVWPLDSHKDHVATQEWFHQDVRIMNTHCFCLNCLYCSIRNNSSNKKVINLPKSPTMIFLQILFYLSSVWFSAKVFLERMVLLHVKAIPEVRWIVFLWFLNSRLSWHTDHLSLKQSLSCLSCIIIGTFFSVVGTHLQSPTDSLLPGFLHNQFHESRSQ